jgi:ABC-type enterochelin transport system permease subunit
VDHSVNLTDLQQIVGQYVDTTSLLIAGGPLAAAGIVRVFITKNKFANIALAGSTAWFAVKALSGPVMGLIGDQFGYLQSLIGGR